jgi:hypothetical protein
MLPHLLNRILADLQIGSVTADGAYDTRKCHNAIVDHGASAAIPPRGIEANHRRRHRKERGTPRIKIIGSATLAKLERIPPPEPRRDKDNLCKTAGPATNGARL